MSKFRSRSLLIWLLSLLSPGENKTAWVGDIEEECKDIQKDKGIVIAFLWCCLQILISLPSFIKSSITWSVIMFKNYLKITFRTLYKNRLSSFINIFSLSIGLAICFAILIYLGNELNFDTFYKDSNSIYRVVRRMPDIHGPSNRNPMAPALKENFPEIDLAVRTWLLDQSYNFNIADESFKQDKILFADPDFFNLFTFTIISGDAKNPLLNPFSVVLTRSVAEKYFGRDNPVGKTVSFDGKFDLQVTAVMEDLPQNTHLTFQLVIPLEAFNPISGYVYGFDATDYRITDEWMAGMFNTYLKLHEQTNPKSLEQKFPAFLQKYAPYNKELLDETLYLQPVQDIHLYSQYQSSKENIGNIKLLYAIAAIGLIILLMSCFNYINLTTARFSSRIKEISIRKIVGVGKKQLMIQFFMEAIIFSSLAILMAFLLIVLFKPVIYEVFGYHLSLELLNNSGVLVLIGITGFMTAILSGSYPAIFFATFQSKQTNKSLFHFKKRNGFRNGLVIFQFSITIILLIGTGVIHKQVQYMKTKELGYTKEQVLIVPIKDESVRKKIDVIRHNLLQQPGISKVSFSSALPSSIQRSTTLDLKIDGERKVFEMSFATVDYYFFDLYDMSLIKGRNFSKDHPEDVNNAIILNESAVNMLDWPESIGKELNILGGLKKVIGVVKNFNFQTLHNRIRPLTLRVSGDPVSFASLTIATDNIPECLNKIERIFRAFAPDRTLDYYFFDSYFDHLYRSEENLNKMIGFCALLAIIIAILGLLGLSSFMTEQRTKEIGIRKVVGATVPGIVFLISKEFTKWVLLANIAAWPAAYFLMNNWLQNFAYRTTIGPKPFILSGLMVFGIGLLSMSFQSIKAALVNPVDSLKYE